jgi:hypothetical protein
VRKKENSWNEVCSVLAEGKARSGHFFLSWIPGSPQHPPDGLLLYKSPFLFSTSLSHT